jgi:hypothetical protein
MLSILNPGCIDEIRAPNFAARKWHLAFAKAITHGIKAPWLHSPAVL